MAGLPWMKWETAKWLADPKLSRCAPETRGIWADMMCHMHEDGRSGIITGTPQQLAQMCRCTESEMGLAIEELRNTGTADVTVSHGRFTLISRKMSREHKMREGAKNRKRRERSSNVTPDVTAMLGGRGKSKEVRGKEKVNQKEISEVQDPNDLSDSSAARFEASLSPHYQTVLDLWKAARESAGLTYLRDTNTKSGAMTLAALVSAGEATVEQIESAMGNMMADGWGRQHSGLQGLSNNLSKWIDGAGGKPSVNRGSPFDTGNDADYDADGYHKTTGLDRVGYKRQMKRERL